MTTQRNTYEAERVKALAMLTAGLAGLSEAAELAGVSRQLVRHWATQEGLDWRRARARHLKREWSNLS